MKILAHFPVDQIIITATIMLMAGLAGCSGRQERIVYYPNRQIRERWYEKSVGPSMSVKDGKFETFYADGSRLSSGEFNNGDSIGVWQEWYLNGGKKFEKTFGESGKRRGVSIAWMPNGDTSEIQTYDTFGELDGRHVSYWPRTGEMREQGEYKNGKRHGLWNRWYRNGRPEWEREYDQGRFVGRWTNYSYLGQVTSSHEYLRDLPVELANSWGSALVDGVPTGKSLEFQQKDLDVDTVAIEERRFSTLMKIGEDWVVPFTWYSPRYPTYYKLKRDTLYILRHVPPRSHE